jgi:hypothetical protein
MTQADDYAWRFPYGLGGRGGLGAGAGVFGIGVTVVPGSPGS